MQRRHLGDQAPVALLRERRSQVAGAQAGLQVYHRDAAPERGQRAGERGGGVALYHHRGRRAVAEVRVELRDHPGEQLGLAAGAAVDRQRHVRREAERVQRLRDHGRVLAARDQHRAQPAGGPHGGGHRGQLDRLRPGTGDEVDFGKGGHLGASALLDGPRPCLG